jgi:hypothetical protein
VVVAYIRKIKNWSIKNFDEKNGMEETVQETLA